MYRVSRILTALTLLVAAYGIALPAVPLAIRILAPPVRNFEIVQATRLPDGQVRLTARIEKRHCVFAALRFAWRGADGEVWRVGYTTTDHPAGADPDRPAGRQSLGPWTIAAPPTASATTLHIAVRHHCGPFAVVTPLAQIGYAALKTEAPSPPPSP